jgi:hypothetical protein
LTVSAVRDSGVDHSDERREHAADRDQHEHETDVPRKLNCSRRKKKSRVSHEDLKLIGLGKAVDEYARMRHARWNSRSTNEREKADASPERRASCSDRSSVGDDDQGAAVVGRVGPANRATTATRRVCFRRACACVVLPPIPSVLFERPLWEMIVALSVPVMTAWCLARCSPVRCMLSGVALFVFGKVSACFQGNACVQGDARDVEASFERLDKVWAMTDRATDVGSRGQHLEHLHSGGERVGFLREREVMAQVERLVIRYGYGEDADGDARVDSMVTAYAWISRLSIEMHLERRHRNVSSLSEAVESVAELTTHLGLH